MAYVLLNSQFATGLQANSALLLQSLRHISEVVPFTIVDARIQLEASQIQPFADAGFLAFLVQLYSLDLDTSLLTPDELTVLNVIREFIQPPPSLACCGSDIPTLLNTSQAYSDRVGSATFEKEAIVELEPTVSCDVFDVQMCWSPVGLAPPLTSICSVLNQLGCVNNKNTFSYLWIDFTADPAGFTYNVDINLRDEFGGTVAILNQNYTF